MSDPQAGAAIKKLFAAITGLTKDILGVYYPWRFTLPTDTDTVDMRIAGDTGTRVSQGVISGWGATGYGDGAGNVSAIFGLLNGLETTQPIIRPHIAVASSRATALTDMGCALDVSAASTITIAPNSSVAAAIGAWFEVHRQTSGAVTVAAGAGVTIENPTGLPLTFASQHASLTFRQRATDIWVISATTDILPPDVQEFTTTGTWTKPAGATIVLVEMIGAGGGGCGGPRNAAGSNRLGGGGGAAGAVARHWFIAADLSSTETVTLGAAGTSGAGASSDNTLGTDGGNGGDTTLGSHITAKGGLGGSNVGGILPGLGGASPASESPNGYGGSSNPTFGVSPGGAAGGNGHTGGGGAGASIPVGNTVGAGSGGGAGLAGAGGTTANAAAGGAGTSGTKMLGGAGGGGGASRKDGAGAAYAGGAGGAPGGGGGGGGASLNGQAGGAGGAGGGAYVRVTTFR